MSGKALYVPGPSYHDPQVRRYAGWWQILEYQRQAIERAGYEVETPEVLPELLAPSPSFARITSYGVAVAHQTLGRDYNLVLGAPSYGCIPMLAHPEAVRVSYGWNNAPHHRNRVLEPEYERLGASFDHSPVGDALYETGLRASDRVFACSPFVRQTHAEVLGDAGDWYVGLVPWGVDSQRFHPGEKRERFTVLFVGGDPVRKGFRFLWEAYLALRQEGLPIDLWVVGFSAPFPADPQLRCFGMVPWAQMPEIMHQCDVLVCPTLEDGVACCVQEAMASGCAVIATPEAAEVYRHPAFVGVRPPRGPEVPYGDAGALARELRSLYQDRNRCWEVGQEMRAIAEEQTWERFVAGFAVEIRDAVLLAHIGHTKAGRGRRFEEVDDATA